MTGQPKSTVSVTDATKQWLRGAPAAIDEISEALGLTEPDKPEPPVEPPPEPEPPPPTPPLPESEDGMDRPTNSSELRQALHQYMNDSYVGMLDPRTEIELTETIVLAQHGNRGRPWGVNGNYASIYWRGPQGDDMIRVEGVRDVSNRGLTIERLFLNGGDDMLNHRAAAVCLRLTAPLGDHGPLYKFNLKDVYTAQASYGFVLEGGVYEGWCQNVHAENMAADGMMMRHIGLGQSGQGVVSNVFVVHPNMSRCMGAGIRAVNSVYIVGGSFILNGDGGVVAPDGLRGMIMCNGENTAGANGSAFVVPNAGWGSVILLCEGSTDAATHARRWDGSQWLSIGAPMLHTMDIGERVEQAFNKISFYGDPALGSQIRLIK